MRVTAGIEDANRDEIVDVEVKIAARRIMPKCNMNPARQSLMSSYSSCLTCEMSNVFIFQKVLRIRLRAKIDTTVLTYQVPCFKPTKEGMRH